MNFLFQISLNFLLFFLSLNGLINNRSSILSVLISLELLLLSVNISFIVFSVYLDDILGQIFSLFILTIAAAESAIGLAIVIAYFRVKGNVFITKNSVLKG